jgi:C-terminal processing protease CtpA/Prc
MTHRMMRLGVLLATGCAMVGFTMAAESAKDREPHVELPTFVVIGFRIPSSWLEVAYECKGPLPFNLVKRVWISKVGHGTPADEVGIKVGDTLLAMGSETVDTMTGVSLHDNLRRDRGPGTRLELTIQTPGKKERTVAIIFK